MQIIKLGIISVIVFSFLITGISLLFPSHIRISKAIDINAGKDSVMNQINKPENWKKWFPGGDSSLFFIVDNKIKGIAIGEKQALMMMEATDSSVLVATVGANSKKGESGWNIFDGSKPNSVTVQWYMDFYLRWYPWEKFSSLLMENRYGPMMEKGLDNLKMLLEK